MGQFMENLTARVPHTDQKFRQRRTGDNDSLARALQTSNEIVDALFSTFGLARSVWDEEEC